MTTLVDAPARVDGVQLLGEMVGSGYRTPPALVRRSDGQVLQLTPLLYLVLDAADGRRSCAEIAELVGRRLGRGVTGSDVRTLVQTHLRPLGLVARADGAAPELKRSNPLLRLKPRIAITSPRTTRRLTDPFQVLFRRPVVGVVVAGFVAVVAWVFFDRGLAASTYDAFHHPQLLVLVFVVSLLSGGFHEFGHAAAARYGGAQPGAMGAGFYLVWPAFYTDVTDSYRLGRPGRLRTDLGGLYFNAIVVLATFAWWWATGWEALLLVVATQVLQMTQQLLPLLRFDGYHVLADLAGVPDLYHRIRPTLAGLLPHRWRSEENRVLTPWARAVITLWVLITVPMMAMMLLALFRAVPRVLGTAGSVLHADGVALADAWRGGDGIEVAGSAIQILGVVLPMAASAMVLGRLGARFFGGLVRWSRGSRPKRLVAMLVSAVVVTVLMWAWWPQPGTYRPIQPDERGLLTTVLEPPASAAEAARPAPGFATGEAARAWLDGRRQLVTAFPEDAPLPTEDHPALAAVLIPSTTSGAAPTPADDGQQAGLDPSAGQDDAWVFPFDEPLPPGEGDNQALAVNTEDGSVTYDVAFALVWADGDEVLNVNEAHAYASCSDCVAVAVAFQVVLVMDDAHVVAPQNLAVSANYDCYRCITAAIASQLVLSVGEQPDEAQLQALADVWSRLVEFAQEITSHTLTEIAAELEQVKAEIIAILGAAPEAGAGPSPSTSASPAGTPSASPSASSTPPAPSGSPTGTGTAPTSTPASSPTASPTTPQQPGSTGSTTSPSPTSSPTSSSSPSPTADAGTSTASP